MRHVSVFAVIVCVLLAAVPTVSAQSDQRCFAETNTCISGRIRQFWEQNGGLAVFGLPLSAQNEQTIEGTVRQVQWFQRARLELHSENAAPYDVLMGRLGVERLTQEGRDWFTFPKSELQAGCQFFAQTGHAVCEPFLSYWRAHGLRSAGTIGSTDASLALFGLPLSEPALESNSNGVFVSQWFERARLEYHPENQTPWTILGGLLGTELTVPVVAATPTPAPTQAPAQATNVCTATPDRERTTTNRYYDIAASKFQYRSSIGNNNPGEGHVYLTMEITMYFDPPSASDLQRVFVGPETFFIEGADGQRYFADTAATAALPRPLPSKMISVANVVTNGQVAFRLPATVAPSSLHYDAKAIAPQYPRAELDLNWPACGAR